MKIINAENRQLIVVRDEQSEGGWYVYQPHLLPQVFSDHSKEVLRYTGVWDGPLPEDSTFDILMPEQLNPELMGNVSAYFALAYERRGLDSAWEYYRHRIVNAFAQSALRLCQVESIEHLAEGKDKRMKVTGVVVNQSRERVASLYIAGKSTRKSYLRGEYVHVSAHPFVPPSPQLFPLSLSFGLAVEEKETVLMALITDEMAEYLHNLYLQRTNTEKQAKEVSAHLANFAPTGVAIYCPQRGKVPVGGFVVIQQMPAVEVPESQSPAYVGMRWVYKSKEA